MVRFITYLSRQSRSFLIILGFFLLAVVWYFDYVTGSELATEVFYLIPIALIALFVGQQEGYLMSLLCAGAWFAADALTHAPYSNPLIPYWNLLVSLLSFLLFSHILSAVRNARDRQEELTHFIVHDLRSPLTNILGGLSALEDSTGSRLDGEERNLIEICQVACRRMLTLITSILDLARLESAKMPVNPAACNPR